MGYNFFPSRAPASEPVSEFAATVAAMPPEPGDSLPAFLDTAPPAADALPSAPDSGIPDVVTDFGGESLPFDAAVEQRPTTSHIGRYALKGLLGQGGLGQVHEAWDPLLSRTVAVKTLQFDIDTPARVSLDSLFLNEARAAAGLSHANIVTVHDAGLSAHGVYIAMERLHGSDLRLKLAAGWRPTPGQSAQLVRRVADALAYDQCAGVVQRLTDFFTTGHLANAAVAVAVGQYHQVAGEERGVGAAQVEQHAVAPGDRDHAQPGNAGRAARRRCGANGVRGHRWQLQYVREMGC